ncbi:MAG TPA: MarR family transcriptional regulator [Ktedonobacterales bacterium]|nr:MarR family transcriptional regulator [Ktedonobacterales bacterium]
MPDVAGEGPVSISPEVRTLAAEVAGLYPAVYRRFHASRHAMPGADVTPRMLNVLQHMVASGPLTVGELVQHLSVSKPATTELVGRLETKGFVARIHDERDRRRVFIWLTDAGRERALAHPRVLEDELLVQALARMRPQDRLHLVEGLRALLAAEEEIPR